MYPPYAYSWYENAQDGGDAVDDASGAGLTSHL